MCQFFENVIWDFIEIIFLYEKYIIRYTIRTL